MKELSINELEMENLKYLESNKEFFVENLEVLSDMIFDRYSVEKTLEKRNLKLIKSYEKTLLELRNLEKILKECLK